MLNMYYNIDIGSGVTPDPISMSRLNRTHISVRLVHCLTFPNFIPIDESKTLTTVKEIRSGKN